MNENILPCLIDRGAWSNNKEAIVNIPVAAEFTVGTGWVLLSDSGQS
jgi:hypothetical protein